MSGTDSGYKGQNVCEETLCQKDSDEENVSFT